MSRDFIHFIIANITYMSIILKKKMNKKLKNFMSELKQLKGPLTLI